MTTLPRLGSAKTPSAKDGDVLLGEDWVSPETLPNEALRADRGRRGLVALNRSPLARKIIVFNLLALVILVSGVLFMNPFRDSLVVQREAGLITEAQLIAKVCSRRHCPGQGLARGPQALARRQPPPCRGWSLRPGSRFLSSMPLAA